MRPMYGGPQVVTLSPHPMTITSCYRVFDALPPGGAFIAIDNLIDDERRTATGALGMSKRGLLSVIIGFGRLVIIIRVAAGSM